MRMGPGKHLKGLTLMNGIVKPEEVRFSISPHQKPLQTHFIIFIGSLTTSTK